MARNAQKEFLIGHSSRSNATYRGLWMASSFFFKMGAIYHLGFVSGLFGRTLGVIIGLYPFAKFGCDRYTSFDNTNVSIFVMFDLKTPIHDPKIGFLKKI